MTDLLTQVNTSDTQTCVAMLGGLVESSPWVVERAMAARPFAAPDDVAQALIQTIRDASAAEQLALICAHPDLAGRAARDNTMTAESNSEQGRLGLLHLSADDMERINQLNVAYRARFGMPFILALHQMPDLAAVLQEFEARLRSTPEREHEIALNQISSVVRNRTMNFFLPVRPVSSGLAMRKIPPQDRALRKD